MYEQYLRTHMEALRNDEVVIRQHCAESVTRFASQYLLNDTSTINSVRIWACG